MPKSKEVRREDVVLQLYRTTCALENVINAQEKLMAKSEVEPRRILIKESYACVEAANGSDHSQMLREMPLNEALWWFIENIPADDPMRNDYFFLLRERRRTEI